MTTEVQCPAYRDGLCPDIITAKEQLKNMTEWQRNQNGTLRRLDAKLDRLNFWIISLLGSALLAVALLAVNIASKRI